MQDDTRTHVLSTAAALFARHGIRRTGVDAHCRKGKISRRTIYREFGSKETLVVAVLEFYAAQWQEWFFDRVEALPPRAENRLWVLWDTLDAWIRSKDFEGCLLRHAMIEFSESKHPIHQAAAQRKRAMHARIRAAAANARLPKGLDPKSFAAAAVLLFEGALATAASGNPNAAREARKVLLTILKRPQGAK